MKQFGIEWCTSHKGGLTLLSQWRTWKWYDTEAARDTAFNAMSARDHGIFNYRKTNRK